MTDAYSSGGGNLSGTELGVPGGNIMPAEMTAFAAISGSNLFRLR